MSSACAAALRAATPGDDGAAGRVDRLGRLLQAGVGVGQAGVVARQRAVADAAAGLRALVQRDQLLEVGDRLLERARSPACCRPAGSAASSFQRSFSWKYASVCLEQREQLRVASVRK